MPSSLLDRQLKGKRKLGVRQENDSTYFMIFQITVADLLNFDIQKTVMSAQLLCCNVHIQ